MGSDLFMDDKFQKDEIRKSYKKKVKSLKNEIELLRGFLENLKMNTCWCGVGIGDPRMAGNHSSLCKRIQNYMDKVSEENTSEDKHAIENRLDNLEQRIETLEDYFGIPTNIHAKG